MLAVVVVAYQLADGVGLPTFGFWATLCVLFIGLPLMVTLVPFGNLGIAVARLAAFSVMIPGVAILERRVFGQIQTRFWLESGIRLLLAGTAAGLAEMLFAEYCSRQLVGSRTRIRYRRSCLLSCIARSRVRR
jgi:hypothetical protein